MSKWSFAPVRSKKAENTLAQPSYSEQPTEKSEEMEKQCYARLLADEYRVWGLSAQEATRKSADMLALCQSDAEAQAALKEAVETLSKGENTVLFDQNGVPSVMVRLKAVSGAELLEGCEDQTLHEVFRTDGESLEEIWVGKYLSGRWEGAAASLPMAAPTRYPSQDEAAEDCRRKGLGWCLTPYFVRTVLSLKSLKEGTLPHGNNDKGHDYFRPQEQGTPCGEGLVLTGSGPCVWSHNGKPSGVWDMNGNLNEWDGGLRLVDGEIQYVPLRDMILDTRDAHGALPWRAMDMAGCPVAPGTAGSLHYDVTNESICLTDQPVRPGIGNCAFQQIALKNGLEEADILKLRGLLPPTRDEGVVLGWRWVCAEGERLPLSGGAYKAIDHAGAFFTGITKPREERYQLAGMRLTYVDPRRFEKGDTK